MSDIKFFYPIKNATQLTFDGRHVVVPLYQEGHLEQSGRLMCGASKDALKKTSNTKNYALRTIMILGVPICKKCQEVYKSGSAYQRWVSPTGTKIQKDLSTQETTQ